MAIDIIIMPRYNEDSPIGMIITAIVVIVLLAVFFLVILPALLSIRT
jgi:membrane protein YdbS with pleckstrin-like domain